MHRFDFSIHGSTSNNAQCIEFMTQKHSSPPFANIFEALCKSEICCYIFADLIASDPGMLACAKYHCLHLFLLANSVSNKCAVYKL
jgi:hypothetical protein